MPRFSIRPFRAGDADALAAIDARATALLADHGYPSLSHERASSADEVEAFATANEAWVACEGSGRPVGYAVARDIAGFLHLEEIAVDPGRGRRGIGSALLSAVIAHAERRGLAGVSLSTFRDVPFNAPFYAARGFVEVDPESADPALRERFFLEVPAGIAPASRVLMMRRTREPRCVTQGKI